MAEMKLQYALFIAILLSRHGLTSADQVEDTTTYKITDKINSCSGWLARMINGFCDNVLKITKRDTSLDESTVLMKSSKTYKTSDSVYTCSSELSLLINGFCDNVLKLAKRDTSIMIDKLMPKSLLGQRKKERLLKAERWRRVRRQVATECCDQPCTVATLLKYCPYNSRVIKERPDIFDYS